LSRTDSVEAALLVALCLCGLPWACARSAPAQRASALLVTLDTTRADALACYGNPLPTSPNLDRLAAEGVLFESAHTTVPVTLPAHASMLTGLYPPRHRLRDNGVVGLAAEARTLAEVAREAGWQTAAFVGSVVLAPLFGIEQGFEHYSAPARTSGVDSQRPHGAERRASEVVDEALAWLARRDRERPFLVWVHLYDPHHPYAPPADFDAAPFAGEPYLAEVAYADAQVGRLLDALRADGTLDGTAVLVTSDHGEAFGEHGEFTHGGYCFEETLRVPFLLRRPGEPRAGERSPFEVSVVDVLPTLAAALGLEVPRGIDGVDLGAVPLSGVEPRGVYFESYYGYLSFGWSPLAGWLRSGGKYLHSSSPAWFELAEDPLERNDRIADRADAAREARVAIARILERDLLPAPEDEDGEHAELLDAIRSLGYAGVGGASTELPSPLATSDLPAPHHQSSFFTLRGEAEAHEAAGRPERALEAYRTALRENPRNSFALEEVGRLLLATGDTAGAVAALEELVADHAPQARRSFGLGAALVAAGRSEDALEPLRHAVELSHGRPRYVQALVGVLRSLGRTEEAERLSAAYLACEEREQ